MLIVSYLLSVAAIAVMVTNAVLALRLRKVMIGGEVGDRWNLLTTLIVVFLGGYIIGPVLLFLNVPVETMGVMVFAVFFLGAIFVLVVIKIIKDTLTFLEMLKPE